MLPLVPTESLFPRLPLLITGITGVAGYNAFAYFQPRYPGKIIGIRSHVTWKLQGDGIVPLDADDKAGLGDLFRTHRFKSVLNCVGNCALKSCELDPAMARQINVVSAEAVVSHARAHGSRLVHLSSDLVFSGKGQGMHLETEPVDPVTIYGKTMVESEQLLLAADPGCAILRISLPMGPSFNRHAGAIDWIDSRFRNSRPATLYFDEVRSCTYCDDLNPVFERLLVGDESGVFHCGGPRPVTLYQIAQIVNRVGGYNPRLLKGCLRWMAGPLPPRAGNVSMNSAKLAAVVGRQPFRAWPVGPELFPSDRFWHFHRPTGEIGNFESIRQRLYRYIALPPTG